MPGKIDHELSGSAYEKQFTSDDPPEDDVAPGAGAAGDDEGGDPPAGTAPAAAPAAAKTGKDAEFDIDALAAAEAAKKNAPATAPAAAPAVALTAEEQAVVDAAAAAPAPAAAPATAKTGVEAEPDEPDLPYTPKAPADAEAQLAKVGEDRDDVLAKYGEGDLTEAEMKAQIKALDAKAQELLRAQATDDAVLQMREDNKRGLFASAKDKAIDALTAAGIVMDPETGKDNRAEFSALVRAYGERASAKGMEDGRNLKASRWALEQATNVMVKLHGKAGTAAAAPATAPAAPAAPKHKTAAEAYAERAVKREEIPPSLAQAPLAGGAAGTAGDEFVHLKDLEGMELERAVAALKPDQLERYLGV